MINKLGLNIEFIDEEEMTIKEALVIAKEICIEDEVKYVDFTYDRVYCSVSPKADINMLEKQYYRVLKLNRDNLGIVD